MNSIEKPSTSVDRNEDTLLDLSDNQTRLGLRQDPNTGEWDYDLYQALELVGEAAKKKLIEGDIESLVGRSTGYRGVYIKLFKPFLSVRVGAEMPYEGHDGVFSLGFGDKSKDFIVPCSGDKDVCMENWNRVLVDTLRRIEQA